MTDCLGSFEWRTLQLTTCERILRTSSAGSDAFGNQNQPNDELIANPTRKRKDDDDVVRPTAAQPAFELQELFATLVEVQTLPSMLMPRYSLLVSDLTSLRHCRVEFWEHEPRFFTPGSFYRFIGKTTGNGVFTAFTIKQQRNTREFEFVKQQQLIQQHQMRLLHAQQMASVQMKAGMFAMQPAPQLGFSLFR